MKGKVGIIKISSKSHSKIKKYCKENAYKLYQWSENILLKNIEETEHDNLQNNKSNK